MGEVFPYLAKLTICGGGFPTEAQGHRNTGTQGQTQAETLPTYGKSGHV